ncbi:MAG: hypothetical protein Q8Q49_02475 [bacterium]|nr:hypothetical protein [bacterium]
MNTIRFFLLLFSLIVFSVVFRLQTVRDHVKTGVLSGKIAEKRTASPLNLHQFFYPNAARIVAEENRAELTTTDTLGDVLSWYYPILFGKKRRTGSDGNGENETVALSVSKNGQKIVVTVTKKPDEKNVLIVIAASPP